MVKILISACLLGENCRYDGKSKPCEAAKKLAEVVELIPVCPEGDGGLTVPREPSERVGDRVMARDGRDVTAQFVKGAEHALAMARKHGCRAALLKERSPSCGRDLIYDGSFSGTLTEGNGVAAALLMQNGIRVFGESEIEDLLAFLS